jgi:hypothetical protein
MGYGVSAYVVRGKELLAVPGSKNQKLLRQIIKQYGSDMKRDDEQYDTTLPQAEVMKEIVYGRLSLPDEGSLYAYTFEYLCKWVGEVLPNGEFVPCNSAWLKKLDRLLQLPISLMGLVNGELPVELPRPDDFPGVGYWPHDQIESAAPMLRTKLFEKPTTALKKAMVADPSLSRSLRQLNGWLWRALGEPGSMIIGFYY